MFISRIPREFWGGFFFFGFGVVFESGHVARSERDVREEKGADGVGLVAG